MQKELIFKHHKQNFHMIMNNSIPVYQKTLMILNEVRYYKLTEN